MTSIPNENFRNIWIGIAHVQPKPDNHILDGAMGAYVVAVGRANDLNGFSQKLVELLESYGLYVLEIEDVEPFSHRIMHHDVHNEILRLANALSDEAPILLDQFECYMDE